MLLVVGLVLELWPNTPMPPKPPGLSAALLFSPKTPAFPAPMVAATMPSPPLARLFTCKAGTLAEPERLISVIEAVVLT